MNSDKIMLYRFSRYLFISISIILIVSVISCNKYLDKRPQKGLYVPSSLENLQAILDNDLRINFGKHPAVECLTDNYFINNTKAQALNELTGGYIWDKAFIFEQFWTLTYTGPVYYSNFVLQTLSTLAIAPSESAASNAIEGSALFNRALAFYELAQAFCKPYSSESAKDYGLVLKQTANVEDITGRSSMQETYDLIIRDLLRAAELLPITSSYTTRPNKAAAYGALARTYLSMRDYTNASLYAEMSLHLNGELLDYNIIDTTSPTPFFQIANPEVSYRSTAYPVPLLSLSFAAIDSNLVSLYDANDLRKYLYFFSEDGEWLFKGSYQSNGFYSDDVFTGVTSAEMYLIKAECEARRGDVEAAMGALDILLEKRWKAGTFVSMTAIDANDALNKILTERRKELIFRNSRWSDLRRFNLDDANITLQRVVNGTQYLLPPNDNRWVCLISLLETSRSGIPQNPR